MDLNGDGNDDLISGSYWPGTIYVFWGKGDAKYAPVEPLKNAEGERLHAGPPWKAKNQYERDSLAAAPFAWDWDADGDLDLLIGNIAGRVILIPNQGSAKEPKFDSTKRRAVEAAGAAIQVEGDAGPFVADWDQDGQPDLLVGSGDGSIRFFRNTGKRGAPEFAAGQILLPKSKGGYSNATPDGQVPESQGTRTKLCVTDWNGDGAVDLLVGDLWYGKSAQRKLTEEETARLAELREKRKTLGERSSKLYAELKEKAKDDPEFKRLRAELSEVSRELMKLEPRNTTHGSVWLYLRIHEERY